MAKKDKRAPLRFKDVSGDSIVEVMPSVHGDCFLTVQRVGDNEDEERVACLSPRQALRVASKLIKHALLNMKKE